MGILVTAPTAITLYLAYIFISFMDEQVARMLPNSWQPPYGESIFPGSGILIAGSFLVLAGWAASNFLGHIFIEFAESLVNMVPGLRNVYNTIKQVVETIMGSQAKAFREVVLIEYPRKGSWTLGFVTGTPANEINTSGKDEELVSVFVPTAPSPVNGFLLFIPRKEITSLKMTVEEGIKMVVSMGIVCPADAANADNASTKDKAA